MKTYTIIKESLAPPFPAEQEKYIEDQGFAIDRQNVFLVGNKSTRASRKKWRETLFGALQEGDTLVCFNLASLGGSTGYIAELVADLLGKGISIQLAREGLLLTEKNHGEIIRLFAQAESDLIAEWTIKSVRTIKQDNVQQGRPAGSISKSKLDPHKAEIQKLLNKGVSIKSIARDYQCSDTAIHSFIKTRKLKK